MATEFSATRVLFMCWAIAISRALRNDRRMCGPTDIDITLDQQLYEIIASLLNIVRRDIFVEQVGPSREISVEIVLLLCCGCIRLLNKLTERNK